MQPQQQQRGSPPECSTATASPRHPGGGGKDATPTRAAGTENTSPATLLRAVEQLDAKLRKAVPTSPRSRATGSHQPGRGQLNQQQRAAARQPVLRQISRAAGGVYCKGRATSGSDAAAASAPSDSTPVPGAEAQHPAAAATPPAADPLDQLLLELMAAEGAGDPYSIINLYVAEQLALQQAGEAQPAASAAPAAPAVPVSALPLASSQPARATRGQAAAALATAQAACSGHSPRAVEASAAAIPVATVEEAQLPHAPPQGWRDPPDKDLLLPGKEQPPPLKEQPSLKLQPSESAPSSARHRRSSSLMLPPQFGVAAAAEPAAEPAEWSIAAAALGGTGLPEGASLGMGNAGGILAAELPPQPSAILRQKSAAAADIVLVEQQLGSGKQLYVQQWLQRSAAELAASESAPACSSTGYSADPDLASAQLDALSSQASPAAGMALPPGPAGVPDQASVLASSPAAAAAATSPEAAATAAPSGVSASSRSASAVTSMRRPGAPEPPSSSSQLDSSSLAPSRSRAVVAPAGLLLPPAPVTLLDVEQAQAPAAEQPSCSSSSWDGRSGTESELQAALSYSQLQAVGVLDGAAVLQAGGAAAAQVAAEECSLSESLHGPPSHSSGAQSAGKVAAPPAIATAAAPGFSIAPAPTGHQASGTLSSEAYSSDFDSDFEDAEISYGDLGAGSSPAPAVVDAAAAAAGGWHTAQPAPAAALGSSAVETDSRPSSPRMVQPPLWQASRGSPPGSAGSQQRPRSPHPAALDDRYPGSPPASGGSPSLQLPVPGATYSRPHSPTSRGGSPRASDDGAVTARPTYPGSAAACSPADAADADADAAAGDSLELPALQHEDTVVVHSPSRSSGSNGSSDGQAGSPYSLVQFGTEPADAVAAEDEVAAVAPAVPALGGVRSPPGTPVVASPGDDHGSCPGSARVEDDTVVQTGAAGWQPGS